MKIAKIKIQNIVGIDEFEVEPGRLTLIEGKNGKGKSSVLKGIETALGGGDYAELLRKGMGVAETVLVLDDNTEIRRKITMNGEGEVSGKVTVTNGDGMKAAKPQTWIDALYNPLQTNPLALLATDKKSRDERLQVLLEAVPMKLTRAEMEQKFPALKSTCGQLDYSRHALEVYDKLYDIVFKSRTEINRDAKKLTGTIAQLTDALGGRTVNENIDQELLDLTDVRIKLEGLRDKYINEFALERRSADQAANDKHAATLELLAKEKEEAQAKVMQTYNERLQELNQWKQQQTEYNSSVYMSGKDNCDTIKTNELAASTEAHDKNLGEKMELFKAKYDPVTTRIAELSKDKEDEKAIRIQTEMRDKAVKEFEELDVKSKSMTESLDAIKAAKESMLKNIPIPGLEIKDADIYYNGISFDMLNMAKRIDLSVEIAKLSAGKLGIICVDGLENFDSETLAAFEAKCKDSDLQVIATRVSDDAELTVHTIGN